MSRMETCFYCAPEDLQEVFSAVEADCPLVYEPFFGGPVTHTRIDGLLRAPFFRCGEIQDFGRVYPAGLRFWVRPAEGARDGGAVSLAFSGPPAYLDDPDVLCEGSICLGPEARGAELRAFYQRLRQALARRFRKTGYCLLSPGVFARREGCLFIQRDAHFLSPAWRFSQGDRHVPAEMDAWYQEMGRRREDHAQSLRRNFFATFDEVLEILRTLEEAFRLRLTGVFPGAGGVCREEAVHVWRKEWETLLDQWGRREREC